MFIIGIISISMIVYRCMLYLDVLCIICYMCYVVCVSCMLHYLDCYFNIETHQQGSLQHGVCYICVIHVCAYIYIYIYMIYTYIHICNICIYTYTIHLWYVCIRIPTVTSQCATCCKLSRPPPV